jgi:hypothetical protein
MESEVARFVGIAPYQEDRIMLRTRTCILLVAAAMVSLQTAHAQQWGNLKGKFVFDGKAPEAKPLNINKDLECCKVKHTDEGLVVGTDGGIANIVVYLRTAKPKVHPDYANAGKEPAVLDNKTCKFEPHVLGMLTSQELQVKNSDQCAHNTNISPLGGGGINPLIPASGDVKHKFTRQQNLPIPVSCNIHPWMTAYVLPRDNPYFAVTGEDGSFEIKNLPAGAELEFTAWQEKAGYVDTPTTPKGKFKKKIAAGDNDLGTIKLKASVFKLK